METLNPNGAEEGKGGTEAVFDGGEEEVWATKDEAGGVVFGGTNVGYEKVEDRGDVGRVEARGEELRARGGEFWEVGGGDTGGVEEFDEEEDVVDGGTGRGNWEAGVVGEDSEASKVLEIFLVICAEAEGCCCCWWWWWG